MTLQELAALPTVNEELVVELYGDTSDPDMVEMQTELWEGIKGDLFRELDEIGALWNQDPNGEVRRVMHRVAGYSGSGGLHRCCEALRAAEKERVDAADVPEALEMARNAANEAITQIETRYPHLASGN